MLILQIDGSIEVSVEVRRAEMELRGRARAAARQRLNELRYSGVIGDSTFQQLEAELDLVELESETRDTW